MENGSYARKFKLGKYCPHFQKGRGNWINTVLIFKKAEGKKSCINYTRLLETHKAAQYTYQEYRLWSPAA